MPRTKQRTPELRERVLRVAVGLLASEGPVAFTTRKVAEGAGTSTPAVYELFGDKAGLVREIYFEGFRSLRARFESLAETASPRDDLEAVVRAFREFIRENPYLAHVMFSRPFADFDPGKGEVEAPASVRRFIVGRVRRCLEAGALEGDETDIAHAIVALVQGLSATEGAGWLGSSKASVERRWTVAVAALLDGFAPPGTGAVHRPTTPRRR